jgi:hypothetical protein
MTKEQPPRPWDPQTQAAINELQAAIATKYPTATFEVGRAEDDPNSVHLTAIVDVDDPDEVGDLVLDRVLELQVEDGIPIHVIPIRTPERVLVELAAERQASRRRPRHTLPIFSRPPVR